MVPYIEVLKGVLCIGIVGLFAYLMVSEMDVRIVRAIVRGRQEARIVRRRARRQVWDDLTMYVVAQSSITDHDRVWMDLRCWEYERTGK